MKKIGIIGAGIMAAGIANNFLKHGYEVFVWNRSADRLKPILEAGATSVSSPARVSSVCDIVIECVSDDEASKGVWLGEHGILAGSDSKKVVIASSTLSLEWIDELSKTCKDKGFQFLDMPLTGSRAGAENGTLKLIVGGEPEVFDSIRGDLAAIADKMYRFGPAGSGTRFKLILNSLIGIHISAAAQALTLAKKAGIDSQLFTNALIDGNMAPLSPAAKLVLESETWESDHPVNFAIKYLEKDLRYAKLMAQDYSFLFSLLEAAHSNYENAVNNGLGELDGTSIKRQFEESS